MEYIKMSRDDLSKRICFWCNRQFGDYPCEPDDCLIGNRIKRLPTVEERLKGKWIPQDNTYTRFMCSVCKGENHKSHEKFCSDCGADMRGEEE